MHVLAGSTAVLATLALTSAAQAQEVPSLTVPSAGTPGGGTPPVTTPEVQVPEPPSGGTPEVEVPEVQVPEVEVPGPPSGGTPNPPSSDQGGGSESGPGSRSGSWTRRSSFGDREASEVAGRYASGGETGGTRSDSGATTSSGKSGAGSHAKSAAKRSSGSARQQAKLGAVRGIYESSGTEAKAIRPLAATDAGGNGPVTVLWLTAFVMLATGVIVLVRQRTQPLRAAPRGKGPLGRRDPNLPPAPWADWDDGANDRPERLRRRE